MGSANEYYRRFFSEQEFNDAVSIIERPSDDEDDHPDGGHPFDNKNVVLEKLAAGFPYNKGGPAREYDWTAADIAKMTELIRDKNKHVREDRKKRPRAIRAQNYRGETSNNYLINWVNSVRSGKRFEKNTKLLRGPKLEHGQQSNHQLWEMVSEILTCEFHYWMEVHKKNLTLPVNQRTKVMYPRLEDLIFRVNDDFTGGLWSQFFNYWEPFINELRLVFTFYNCF